MSAESRALSNTRSRLGRPLAVGEPVKDNPPGGRARRRTFRWTTAGDSDRAVEGVVAAGYGAAHQGEEGGSSLSARTRIQRLVEAPHFQHAILLVILLNAVALGAEASPPLLDRYGDALRAIDRIALVVFVAELLAKLFVYRLRFFRDPWNCFDFIVVGVSLIPAAGAFVVLRALRVLRVLRVVSLVPSMRQVVGTLLASLPGATSIAGLLILITYVAGVMATKLFGDVTPDYFGDLGRSLWTLFQVMTGESWPDIAAEVMAERPAAWIFFLTYILVSTFVVLNLFLAVVVNAMETVKDDDSGQTATPTLVDTNSSSGAGAALQAHDHDPAVLAELAALREEVRSLRTLLTRQHSDNL